MEQPKQQTKRKNSGFYALVALLLIITIVASGLGIYAWAKYTSNVNGNATATVAKWSFNVNLKKGGNTVTLGSEAIDLATTTNHVANNRIAPGTSGTFDIEIDTTGTEVDMMYEVTLGLEYCPRNITFSRKTGVNDQNEDVFTPISAGGAASLTRTGITFSEYVTEGNNGVHTERIKWDWPYEDANDEDYDTRDKEDEIAIADTNHHTTMTISVTGTEMLSKPLTMGTLKNGDTPIANGSTINMNANDTTTLSVEGAESVTYSSSDSSKVTVNATTGAVEAVAAGSAVITITGVDSGETATVNVNVTRTLAIGDTVNYSTTLNGQTLNNWKVFYVDGNYTYLIYGDYLPNAALTSDELINGTSGEEYVIYPSDEQQFVNAITTQENWNSLLIGTLNGTINVNESSNTNALAIGSPTLEMWLNSWNTKYPNYMMEYRYDDDYDYGYHYIYNCYLESIDSSTSAGHDDTLYFPHTEEWNGSYGYWLGSAFDGGSPMHYVDVIECSVACNDSDYDGYSLRPIIKLPSSVVNQ